MYSYVGSGKYWKVLLFASISGLIGALIEHSTLAYICQKNQRDRHPTRVVSFFIEEIFWILCEYSIPILNLIKIEALDHHGKLVKIIKGIILTLFIPFSMARMYDGYDRMMKGYLNTERSRICHGIAFGVMALSDIICTISIILYERFIYKENLFKNSNITTTIKNSSYTVLITVDFVSIVLSTLYVISTFIPNNETFRSSTTLFHGLKSAFILILGIDALILKYEMNNCSNSQGGKTSLLSNRSITNKSKSISTTDIYKQTPYTNSNNHTFPTSLEKNDTNEQIRMDKKKK